MGAMRFGRLHSPREQESHTIYPEPVRYLALCPKLLRNMLLNVQTLSMSVLVSLSCYDKIL